MRERFLQDGLDHFQPHEALELLLYNAVPRGNTNPTAHALLAKFGSVNAVLDAPYEELLTVEGVKAGVATYLKILPQFCRMYYRNMQSGERLTDYTAQGEYLLKQFIGRTVETAVLLLLDSKCKVLYCGVVNEGNTVECQLYMKTLVRLAVQYDAVYGILAHNHPSGSCLPSKNDLEMTCSVYNALASVEVRLEDHFIIGSGDYLSMKYSRIMPELFSIKEEPDENP